MKPGLHSRYNPQGEAERYLGALAIPPGVRCFILIEPGLGYMIPILVQRFPAAKVLVLHVEAPPVEAGGAAPRKNRGRDTAYWDPGLPLSPEGFLERELGDLAFGGHSGGGFGAESIKIIEWRPSRDRYGERYVTLLAAAAAAIRRFDAEYRTLRAFGRRWLRNFFKNLRLPRYIPVYRGLSSPVVVTGAGPSLEESLDLIGLLQKQEHYRVIASSSSAMALFRRGIVPDLVLSTDGGGWALLHLYELFRRTGPGNPPEAGGGPPALAASFIASLPSQCGELPILGISDGSLWQTLVLRGLGIPHLVLPQRGTVTATAVDLALSLSRGAVGIAGIDLDTRDIRTHVRPYSFDRLWREGASRFRGEYGQHFFRRMALREGGSHRIYAEWFAAQLASYPGRLHTLGNNNPLFENLPRMGAPDPSRGKGTGVPETVAGESAGPRAFKAGGGADPVSRALDILKAGLGDPATGKALKGELSPLLLSGGSGGESELRAELESLARPYLGVSGPADPHG